MASSAMGLATGTTSFIGFQHAQFTLRRCPETRVSLSRERGGERSMVAASMKMKGGLGFSRGGSGVLDRPSFDQSQFEPLTQVQEGTIFSNL